MKKYFFVFLLLISTMYAMGEAPIQENNLAYRANLVMAENPELNKLVDGFTGEAVSYKNIIVDLGSIKYIGTINVYQKTEPGKIMFSTDVINWVTANATINYTEKYISYELAGQSARYIRITNSEIVTGQEIVVIPYANYRLSFEAIDAVAGMTTCSIKVVTNMPCGGQVLFGKNFDFIYNKKLTGAAMIIDSGKEKVIQLNNLDPETTYRYQVRIIDYNNRELLSNYFTFTTEAQK